MGSEKISSEILIIFEKINDNQLDNLAEHLAHTGQSLNITDDYGISPLQHASYIGNERAVQILLEQGADVNYTQHGANYTALHFAALSGNLNIVLTLLKAGANINAVNSILKSASEIAAFVGNHQCSATINNYVPRIEIEKFSIADGEQTEPLLKENLIDSFHNFVTGTNIHPVRVALNLQKYALIDHLIKIKRVLIKMGENEMQKAYDINEAIALKYHYLSWIVAELIRCQENFPHDFVELFSKRILKRNKIGQLEFLECLIRDCVREFPFRECTIFRHVVSQLANKDCLPALDVLKNAFNGPRNPLSDAYCSSCGEEKPDKKCSKCKEVQYCDRECQRLHWFMHKKTCARPISTSSNVTSGLVTQSNKRDLDTTEISEQLRSLVAS